MTTITEFTSISIDYIEGPLRLTILRRPAMLRDKWSVGELRSVAEGLTAVTFGRGAVEVAEVFSDVPQTTEP